MIIWIAVLVAAATILILFRQRRTESEALEIPSAMVMLFHPTKGISIYTSLEQRF